MEDKVWYVHIHTNKINNKKYIGISYESKSQTKNPNRSIAIKAINKEGLTVKIFKSKKDALDSLNVVCYTSLNNALEKHKEYKNYYWEYIKK